MFADQTSEDLRLQVERKNSVTVRCFHCLFVVYLKPHEKNPGGTRWIGSFKCVWPFYFIVSCYFDSFEEIKVMFDVFRS